MLVPERASVSSFASIAEASQPRSAAASGILTTAFTALGVENDHNWAWANYKRTVADLSRRLSAHRLIEIGGGRDPLFSREEIGALGADLTVNDISPVELGALPPGYKTACFDIADKISGIDGLRSTFDLAFSRMVFEHVADGRRAWTNLYDLLAPGGVGLAFVPTLYALPFVLNRILPDRFAAAIVKAIFQHRTDDDDPVFPARYSWCVADETRLGGMLAEIGYREIVVQPFYGHDYYRYFPIVRDIHEKFTAAARRRDWRLLASFAYIAARK
jgi:SAM-dependent methyltransferase